MEHILMRRAIMVGVLLTSCECDPALVVPLSDGGVVASPDGGSANDAGPTDAGERPRSTDLPTTDAGPCDFDDGTPTFTCEGDEDFCEPEADLGRSEFDVVALWSRRQGDEFQMAVRFRGRPFTIPGSFFAVFELNENASDDDRFLDFNAAVESGAAPISGDVDLDVSNEEAFILSGAVIYPPSRIIVASESPPNFFSPTESAFRVREAGFLIELIVPFSLVARADGTSPLYAMNVNYADDQQCGDEVSGNSRFASRGGWPDNLDPYVEPAVCIVAGGEEPTCQ